VEQPTTDQRAWRAWWTDHGVDMKPGRRFRRGMVYTPAVVHGELDHGLCTPAERRALQWELVIRTGHVVRLDPHDFVVVQQAALREWAPIAQKSGSQHGSWNRPEPRRS
jgi:hypothetical protein